MNIPNFDIKIDLKLLKTCQKNRLKIDELYTHQIPPNIKFFLSPSKENKFCLSSNNLTFTFKENFLFTAQLGRKHKLVVGLILNMFAI